eukprot:gb/GFBE01064184.1/.p1 GENE.gb/GFBE01064184.1/~~gb/GFBE01064184.1/.p1  ORF type:complete len:820 (+),score=197.24 gb/GFBE01064184.1/:1-2460(+)
MTQSAEGSRPGRGGYAEAQAAGRPPQRVAARSSQSNKGGQASELADDASASGGSRRPPRPAARAGGGGGGYPARRPSSAHTAQTAPQKAAPQRETQRGGAQRRACSLPPLQAERKTDAVQAVAAESLRRSPSGVPSRPPGSVQRKREAMSAPAAAQSSPSDPSSSSRPPKRGSQGSGGNASNSNFRSELDDWKRRHGAPPESRVFSITGNFPGIRKALVSRGWTENEDRESRLWDFRYALWQRDLGELNELDDAQVVNYFARNSELTSKVGLCNSLYGCCTLDRVDVNSFFPRCFDFTTPVQVEHFVEDFKLTTCCCLLRRFVEGGGLTAEGGAASKGYPQEVVRVALEVCKRRAKAVDELLDEAPCPAITEEEWTAVKLWSLKTPGKALKAWGRDKAPSAKPAAKASKASPNEEARDGSAAADDCSDEDGDGGAEAEQEEARPSRCEEDEALYAAAHDVVEKLRQQLPQFSLDGHQNIWVLKPAGKSRGRGIQLSARLEKIQEVAVGRGAEARWIAQKYIENPLIIEKKKFDIRQWVLVTRWNPLAAWFYQDCYLRFSFADYDPKKLKNKYAHLTNNSISKHAEDFEEQKDDTMMHSDDFSEFLATLKIERNGKPVEDPWLEIVQPAMKNAVLRSLECAQDNVMHRSNSFELFGYDFMVDEDLNVWLIEVNSSPDLSYSTATTKQLVKSMIEDMVAVVVDVEKFGLRMDRPKRKWGSCRVNSGRYELLEPARRRREEKFRKLRKDAQSLTIQGSSLKLRKPKKGECPRGPDAEDDPRFDASALLAAAAEAGTAEETAEATAAGDLEDEDDDEESEDEG